jgi:hypothetical protein
MKQNLLISTIEASEILGVSRTDFNYVRKQLYPGMLDIHEKKGVSNFYRKPDVVQLKALMDEDCKAERLRKNYQEQVKYNENRKKISFEQKIETFFQLGKEIEQEIKSMYDKHQAIIKAISSLKV